MTDVEAENWDPEEDAREYYRHSQTGDRGWRVIRDGKAMIRLDRAAKETVLPLVQGQWDREEERRPFTRQQVTLIAFEADRKLCQALGLYGLARLEWPSLTAQVKKAWIEQGPSKPAIRHELYEAIFQALAGLME